MASFVVNVNELKTCSEELNSLYNVLKSAKAALNDCKNGLNSNILSLSYGNVRLTINNISKSIDNQLNHIRLLSDNLEKIADLYARTEMSVLGIDQSNAEIENKEKETRRVIASITKFAVFALCVAASVAVIVGTGGTATPLVLGAVGAATSVATTATNTLADEYAEKGNLNSVDWGKLGRDVTVAGITGFITDCAGGYIVKGFKSVSLIKYGMNSSNLIGRAATNMGVEAIKDTAVGIGNRAVTSIGYNISQGEFNVSDILGTAFNRKELAKDAVGGAITGTVGEIVDSAAQIKNFDSKWLNSSNSAKRTFSGFGVEGVKGAVSGVGERFEEALFDGKSVGTGFKEGTDIKEVLNDFVKEGAKGASYQNQGKPVGRQNFEKDLNNPDIYNSMPSDAPDAKSWIENKGNIYVDSAGKVTYEKKIKENNRWYKEYKERTYYDSNGNVENRK